MYSCQILADSLSPQGQRLTTMKTTFPRFILAEFNTHRMFSRNSASSRAIPFKKMVQMVEENPFIPLAWQKDHKGMQGTEYFTNESEIEFAKSVWLTARDYAISCAETLNNTYNGYGSVTKQLCNRLLEPFMWHTVIVTSGKEGLDNFFNLRCPQYHTPVSGDGFYFRSKKDCIANHSNPDNISKLENMTDVEWLQINKSQAEIHIQAIAELMWDAYNESTPKQLEDGEWHIPFGDNFDDNKVYEVADYRMADSTQIMDKAIQKAKVKIATARCARISYETLGDNPKIDYEADIRLHDMLLESGHMSPFEHCAKAMDNEEYNTYHNGKLTDMSSTMEGYHPTYNRDLGWCRNFRGFIQYRHLVE